MVSLPSYRKRRLLSRRRSLENAPYYPLLPTASCLHPPLSSTGSVPYPATGIQTEKETGRRCQILVAAWTHDFPTVRAGESVYLPAKYAPGIYFPRALTLRRIPAREHALRPGSLLADAS